MHCSSVVSFYLAVLIQNEILITGTHKQSTTNHTPAVFSYKNVQHTGMYAEKKRTPYIPRFYYSIQRIFTIHIWVSKGQNQYYAVHT